MSTTPFVFVLVFALIVGFASALRLYSVGLNLNALTGDGTSQYVAVPQNISSRSILSNTYVSKLFVGGYSSHVLANDGALYAWVCFNKILIA
jgi:alpha-tubulin suppressor-like RCC1 family protein